MKIIYQIFKKSFQALIVLGILVFTIFIVLMLISNILLGSVYLVLPNGFILSPTNSNKYNISLLDDNKNLIIEPNIKSIGWYDNYVYGQRQHKDSDKTSVFSNFICQKKYGCEIYWDKEFKHRLQEIGIPYIETSDQYSYEELLSQDHETYKCFFCN